MSFHRSSTFGDTEETKVLPLHCRTTNRSREHQLLQYHLASEKPLHKLSALVIKRLQIEDLLEPLKAVKDDTEKSLFLEKLEEHRSEEARTSAVYWLIRARIESHDRENYTNAVKMFENAFSCCCSEQELDTLLQKRNQFSRSLKKRGHTALAAQMENQTSNLAFQFQRNKSSIQKREDSSSGGIFHDSAKRTSAGVTTTRPNSSSVLKPLHNVLPLAPQHKENINLKSVESIVKSQMMTPEVVRLNREMRRKQRFAGLPRTSLFQSPLHKAQNQTDIVILTGQENSTDLFEPENRRESLFLGRRTSVYASKKLREDMHAARRESLLLGQGILKSKSSNIISQANVKRVLSAGEDTFPLLPDTTNTPQSKRKQHTDSDRMDPNTKSYTPLKQISTPLPYSEDTADGNEPSYIYNARMTPNTPSDSSSIMGDEIFTPLKPNMSLDASMEGTPQFTPFKMTPLSKPAQRVKNLSSSRAAHQKTPKRTALFAKPQRIRRDSHAAPAENSIKKRKNPRFAPQDSDDDEEEIPAHIYAQVTPSKKRQTTQLSPATSQFPSTTAADVGDSTPKKSCSDSPLTSPFDFFKFAQSGWTPKPLSAQKKPLRSTPGIHSVHESRKAPKHSDPLKTPEKCEKQEEAKRNLFGATPPQQRSQSHSKTPKLVPPRAQKLPFQSPMRSVAPRIHAKSETEKKTIPEPKLKDEAPAVKSFSELKDNALMQDETPQKPPVSSQSQSAAKDARLRAEILASPRPNLARNAKKSRPRSHPALMDDNIEVIILQPPPAPRTLFQICNRAREFVYLREVKQLKDGRMVELPPYQRCGPVKTGNSRRGRRRVVF